MEKLQEQVEYVQKLNPTIQEALVSYTINDFEDINGYLRGQIPFSPTIQRKIDAIDNAFALAPAVEEAFTVYRGQTVDTFNTLAYTSTTFNMDITSDYFSVENRCCMFVITVSNGAKALPLQPISNYRGEVEVLLDRNGRFSKTFEEEKVIVLDEKNYQMRLIYLTYFGPVTQQLESETDYKIFEEKQERQEAVFVGDVLGNIVSNMADIIRTDEEITETPFDPSDVEALNTYAYQSYEAVRNLIGSAKLPAFDPEVAGIIIGAYLQSRG